MAGQTRIYDPFYGDIEFEAEEGGLLKPILSKLRNICRMKQANIGELT